MPLNKVKGNMYDWISGTWNPIGGCCPHRCEYCYVNNFRFPALKKKYSGARRLYENEFKKNLGKGKFWFVGSCFDIFADGIPIKWIIDILEHCRKYNNRYLFQSKNPQRIYNARHWLPADVVLGTTIETNRCYLEMGLTPDIKNRAWGMYLLNSCGYKTIITLEPLIDFDLDKLVDIITTCHPTWVNIGANTNTKIKLLEPSPKKIKELISKLKKITKVKIKPNLKRLKNE